MAKGSSAVQTFQVLFGILTFSLAANTVAFYNSLESAYDATLILAGCGLCIFTVNPSLALLQYIDTF